MGPIDRMQTRLNDYVTGNSLSEIGRTKIKRALLAVGITVCFVALRYLHLVLRLVQ